MPRKKEEKFLELESYPDLGVENPVRILYHRGNFDAAEVKELARRGYNAVDLITLPRQSDGEQYLYLLAKAQAIEEGTVISSPEERRQLTLMMQAFGMLNAKNMNYNVKSDSNSNDIEVILDWQKSRHTFRENSAIDIQGRTPEELREETHKKVADARARAESKVAGLRAAEARSKGEEPVKKKKKTAFSKKKKTGKKKAMKRSKPR